MEITEQPDSGLGRSKSDGLKVRRLVVHMKSEEFGYWLSHSSNQNVLQRPADFTMNMDMGSSAISTITSMVMMSATVTSGAAASTTTDFTPGKVDSKGEYVPTSAERTAYQALRVPWANEVVYGYYTLAFVLGLLAIFTFSHGLWKLRVRYGIRFPLYSRVVAVLRLGTYPRLPHHQLASMLWTFGPLGPNLLLVAGLLFASCLTWINKYYYYAQFYGSAPLYLRSEWIAMATLPFV